MGRAKGSDVEIEGGDGGGGRSGGDGEVVTVGLDPEVRDPQKNQDRRGEAEAGHLDS